MAAEQGAESEVGRGPYRLVPGSTADAHSGHAAGRLGAGSERAPDDPGALGLVSAGDGRYVVQGMETEDRLDVAMPVLRAVVDLYRDWARFMEKEIARVDTIANQLENLLDHLEQQK